MLTRALSAHSTTRLLACACPRRVTLSPPSLFTFISLRSHASMADKPLAPPIPAVQQDAAAATAPADVPLDENGQPLTKSALKRLEKEKALAAKKALKQAANAAKPPPKVNEAKKEKKEKAKKDEAVADEPAYKDVPEGHKKGACSLVSTS